ncbi:MAG: hypothetical protein JKY61_04710 [Planctomycetes bacterium]|nr:hypothetical protein [Planctomycetota bacterium]
MRNALESLPWARKATVDYPSKQATVTAVSKNYDETELLKALKDAGFGGAVVSTDSKKKSSDDEPAAKPPEGPRVAFHVTGMKKTKSGAT